MPFLCNSSNFSFKKDSNKYINFTKDRLYNDKRYSVSSKKIRKLGWKPKRSLIEDLPMIIKWYQKNHKIFELNEKKI